MLRNRYKKKKNKLVEELQQALDEDKTLQRCLPICANYKKSRDGEGGVLAGH